MEMNAYLENAGQAEMMDIGIHRASGPRRGNVRLPGPVGWFGNATF